MSSGGITIEQAVDAVNQKATEHKDAFWSADGPQTGHCICHGWCG